MNHTIEDYQLEIAAALSLQSFKGTNLKRRKYLFLAFESFYLLFCLTAEIHSAETLIFRVQSSLLLLLLRVFKRNFNY